MTKPKDIFSASFIKPTFHHLAYPTEPSSNFTIYPIQHLPKLIETIKEKSKPRVIRYVLDCSGKLWFSEGGHSNEFIPMHFQMTGDLSNPSSCIAAGYLELSSSYQEISMINHDSGFRTSLDSIKWPLIVLVTLLPQINMSLASDLRIEELSPNGALLDLHVLDREEIQAWIQEQFESQLEGFREQPDEIKIISYSRPTHGFFSSLDEKATNNANTSATYGVMP